MMLGRTAIAAACIWLPADAAWARADRSSPFDGEWNSGPVRCLPDGGGEKRLTLKVNLGKFRLRWRQAGQAYSCSVLIASNGTFENKACELPVSGRWSGDTIDLEFKPGDSICSTVLKREP